tara:strand:- start:303 stop:1295 length:993 start_codon:yes stop_codon:yes gene_type:complete
MKKNLPATIAPTTLPELETFARMASSSGYFSDAREAAQAMVKIAAGLEMGIAPIQAMTSIHVIKGRVTLSANLMAAQVRRAGYRYQVAWDDGVCSITFYDGEQALGESSFSMRDAKQAGLSGGGWSKYPRNMLFARAMMNGVRWYLPELALGIYDPEELAEPAQVQRHEEPLIVPDGELPEIPTDDWSGDFQRGPDKWSRVPQDEATEEPAQVIEAEVIEDDGSYPGEVWNAANRGLMAVVRDAGLTRDEVKELLEVDTLTGLSARDLNMVSLKCRGYHNWRDSLDECRTIDELRDSWKQATSELSNGWQKLAAKAKDCRKAQLLGMDAA